MSVSLQCPPVAIAIAKMKQERDFADVTNTIKFNVVELCDLMGWDSSPVKKELKLLEWNFGLSFLVFFYVIETYNPPVPQTISTVYSSFPLSTAFHDMSQDVMC